MTASIGKINLTDGDFGSEILISFKQCQSPLYDTSKTYSTCKCRQYDATRINVQQPST